MKKFHWGLLSKNRNVIYGFSILWIAFFHMTFYLDYPGMGLLKFIKAHGDMGVDVFMLLSGVSLYNSYRPGDSRREFYKRRMKRVLIPALLVMIPYFIYWDLVICKMPLKEFLLDMTGLSLFLRGTLVMWFVIAICVFYLLYPLIRCTIENTGWTKFALVGLLACVIAFNFELKVISPSIMENCSIMLRRLPIFITGCYLGKFVKEDLETSIKYRQLPVIVIISLLLLWFAKNNEVILCRYIASLHYLYWLFAIPVAMLFSILGELKYVSKVIGSLAPYTLEIYLTHEKCNKVLSWAIGYEHPLRINAAAICVTLIVAIVLKKLEKLVIKLIEKKAVTAG